MTRGILILSSGVRTLQEDDPKMAASLPHSAFHGEEPEPRSSAGGAIIGKNFFVFRGEMSREPPHPRALHMNVYATSGAAWSEVPTSGQHPESLWGFACVAIDSTLFYFGGYDGRQYSNVLRAFDSIRREWIAQDCANPDAAPMPKAYSAMISVDSETLCTLGGFGVPVGLSPPGSSFVPFPYSYSGDGSGYTDALHLYSLKSSKHQTQTYVSYITGTLTMFAVLLLPAVWSVPHCSGEGPPPLWGHTFTRIDLLRAVVYGGNVGLGNYLAAMFILNIQTWVCEQVVGWLLIQFRLQGI